MERRFPRDLSVILRVRGVEESEVDDGDVGVEMDGDGVAVQF